MGQKEAGAGFNLKFEIRNAQLGVGFEFRVSSFGFRVSGFQYRISVFMNAKPETGNSKPETHPLPGGGGHDRQGRRRGHRRFHAADVARGSAAGVHGVRQAGSRGLCEPADALDHRHRPGQVLLPEQVKVIDDAVKLVDVFSHLVVFRRQLVHLLIGAKKRGRDGVE